jgi:isopenicillin-N N-acyltransferase-like protein
VIAHHIAREATPADRGRGLGERFAGEIATTLATYGRLFEQVAGLGGDEVARLGGRALERIAAWSPGLGAEIEGIAAGAGQPAAAIAALNARTELLALGGARRGECTVAARVGDGPPVAVQTWDWHEELAGCWHVLTVDAPGARPLHTLTEYGIVGKIGVNGSGVGLLVNILHHRSDGARDAAPGVPVHVVARRVLDDAGDIAEALAIAGSAAVSASSSLTVVAAAGGESGALSVELCPGGNGHALPAADGLLVHTNHFLSELARPGDLEPATAPDTLVRFDVVRRRLTARPPESADAAIAGMRSHLGGAGAVCCHPAAGAPFGERYATLATVAVDAERRTLAVRRGGPCDDGAERWSGAPLERWGDETTTKETE